MPRWQSPVRTPTLGAFPPGSSGPGPRSGGDLRRLASRPELEPLFVLRRLNRARVAERLGQGDQAAGLYQYVLDAWRHADPEPRPHVAAARDGREQLVGSRESKPRVLSSGPQGGSTSRRTIPEQLAR